MQYNSLTSQFSYRLKLPLWHKSQRESFFMMQRKQGSDLLADGKLLIQTEEPALEQSRVDYIKIAVLIDVAALFEGNGRVF